MSRWMKVAAVALAAVGGLIPAFAQLSYAQAVPVQEVGVVLPQGDELSEAELHDVYGEQLATVVAVGAGATIAGFGEYFRQRDEIRRGQRSNFCAVRIATVATQGALGTAAILAAPQIAVHLKACARALAATAATAHGHLHKFHMTLHTHVREPIINPVINVFRDGWNWLWGRR
jgi:hypothetical protein